MEILLVTLHVRRSAQSVPLAAGCLAAALPAVVQRKTRLLDVYPDQTDNEILSAILADPPQLVGFPVYVWNRLRVVELANRLKEAAPRLHLVAGGPEASGDPRGLAAAAPWSALILGEGERSFAALVDRLDAGRAEPLPGIFFPGEDAGPPSLSELTGPDLDSLASPWLQGILAPTPQGGVLWEASRGCAFNCDYCFEAGSADQGVRTYPRERLQAELELFSEIGVSQVWVLDSTFNFPPRRGIELLELLLTTAPHLHYHLEAKADFLDRQTANLLGRLSCSVQLGLQSTDREVLQTVHRSLDLTSLAEKVRLLDANGVTYGFDLIFGLPRDSLNGFLQSLDTVIEFLPNHVHAFPLALLPGTRLARERQRHQLIAAAQPPYEIISSASWPAADLERCRLLTAALEVFYNTGRAVAFFPALLHLFDESPHRFFAGLTDWAVAQPDIGAARLLDSDAWDAADAHRLQQSYLGWRLRQTGRERLITAVFDLLCYHYHYAETLLGEELPASLHELPGGDALWERPWQRAPQLRLVPFAYEVVDLLEMEGLDLDEFVELFRPVGSTALFLRRGGEVICESLGEDLLRLLRQSDGRRSPAEIFAGSVAEANGRELVAFAVGEGLLLAAEGDGAQSPSAA
ncbi:MAG: DUF4080 domain-containing protein [Desulfuromonadales bacterium]|nr:DUF4080 domain-containing protein [Desulfuromonadales bacterium]